MREGLNAAAQEGHNQGNENEASSNITRRSLLKGVASLGGAAALSALTGLEAGALEQKDVTRRIQEEADKALVLIREGDYANFFSSPYLIFTLYCSANFLKKLAENKIERDISGEIMTRLAASLSPAIRERYIRMLDNASKDIQRASLEITSSPLERFNYGQGKNHPDAVDLFTQEGVPVKTIRAGVVVQAEKGWAQDNSFSVSSLKGGNSVIVYYPGDKDFYRYCHLQDVFVKPKDCILAGRTIGTVGHSGTNAAKPGHGKHLHLEINYYQQNTGTMQALSAEQIIQKIKNVG